MSDMPSTPWTVDQAQQHARASGLDRLDTQMLLCALLQQRSSWLITHGDGVLSAEQTRLLHAQIQRRAGGEPLAYILGDKEFFGLTLAVSPAVLIPRPDTETLVEWAIEKLPFDEVAAGRTAGQPIRVLDLGTGSGAIALALQHQRPGLDVTAVDASEAALRTAQANAAQLQLPVRFLLGSWLTPVAGERFELIVSNPPYIAEGDPYMAALHHEPRQALTSGPDGLDDIRHIVAHAQAHLSNGGWLMFEHGYDQAEAVAHLMRAQGFTNVNSRHDLGGNPRCTVGQSVTSHR